MKREKQDLEFVKNHIDSSKFDGFTIDEQNELLSLIKNVQPTDTESRTIFPDFISEDGFIEHFEVTSGKETRKGADVVRRRSDAKKEHINVIENKTDDKQGTFSYSTIVDRSNESLAFFTASFKKNWEKHINSLKKYNGAKHASCFLISSDDVLLVGENCCDTNGLFYGNFPRHRLNFKLCYCFDLLNWIYTFANEIDYVIYYNQLYGCVECIKVSNIPYLMKFMSQRSYSIYTPFSCAEIEITSGVRIEIKGKE